MGRDNVLVVRQKDRTVKAMLNTCAHRGNAVCRAEEGNAKSFLCTYHGWSYGIDGQLLGVPGFKTFYADQLDKSKHGLAQVEQVATYKGFIFGTHDISAPPLEQFLGATGRLGLDMIAARGDMVVVPGIQKFIIDCNWKIAVDNLFDWYHPQVTHASGFLPGVLGTDPGRKASETIDMSDVNMDSGGALDMPGIGISGTKFDQVVVLGEYGHAIGGPTASSLGNPDFDKGWRATPQARAAREHPRVRADRVGTRARTRCDCTRPVGQPRPVSTRRRSARSRRDDPGAADGVRPFGGGWTQREL